MIDVHEVVEKLIGQINPIGETNTDNDRLESLKKMIVLADSLLNDITHVAARYRNNQQYSMKKASETATKFLDGIGIKSGFD